MISALGPTSWLISSRGNALILAVCILVSLIASVAYLALSRPLYVASAIVYPAADIDPHAVGPLGGLGLLDQSTSPPTPFQKFIAILHTPRFITEIDRKLHLAERLFPGEWDAAQHRWHVSTGVRNTLAAWLGRPQAAFDPEQALADVFERALTVTETDKRNSITRVAVSWPDREIADDTLHAVLEVAQALLIDEEQAVLTREIAYLESQLDTVQLGEHRAELARLLVERERQMMMLRAGAYGAQILQPAYTPPEPDYPSVRLTLLLALVGGAALGIAVASLRAVASAEV